MLHINRFIDKIKALEAKQVKTFTMSVQEAKDLHADITKLLLVVEEMRQRAEAKPDEDTTVEVSGGKF